jgi:hypothetical protein
LGKAPVRELRRRSLVHFHGVGLIVLFLQLLDRFLLYWLRYFAFSGLEEYPRDNLDLGTEDGIRVNFHGKDSIGGPGRVRLVGAGLWVVDGEA